MNNTFVVLVVKRGQKIINLVVDERVVCGMRAISTARRAVTNGQAVESGIVIWN
jgi:hypothetical protein